MSGEPPIVELLADPAGQVTRLVEAAAALADAADDRIALVGGLAVMSRLGTVHRVTRDVDAVTESPSKVIEMLVSAGGTSAQSNRVVVAGVRIELIEVPALEEVADVDSDHDRLGVLAHTWALAGAKPMSIRVAGTASAARLRVATAPSLVAMKTGAISERRDTAKRASDLYDIYRLIGHERRLAEALGTAPRDLAALVRAELRRLFDTEATRSARWLAVYGDESASRVAEDDLRQAAAKLG